MTIIVVTITLIILLIIPQVMKKVLYKKLTMNLSKKEYATFESLLDGFLCTFSFRPYNREFMRLSAYYMQQDNKKIEHQLDNMFQRFKMKDTQKQAVAKRGFYFYMELKRFDKASKMLKICEKANTNVHEQHVMNMMYSILALKKSDYINEMKERLNSITLDQQQSDAQRVQMGIFQYLLGLQYNYQNNKKTSERYLESALSNCKNTPYERDIQALLK